MISLKYSSGAVVDPTALHAALVQGGVPVLGVSVRRGTGGVAFTTVHVDDSATPATKAQVDSQVTAAEKHQGDPVGTTAAPAGAEVVEDR